MILSNIKKGFIMCNKTLFKQAHALAKQVHIKGDSYQVTFGLCLKQVMSNNDTQDAYKALSASYNLIVTTAKRVYYQVLKQHYRKHTITSYYQDKPALTGAFYCRVNKDCAMIGDYIKPVKQCSKIVIWAICFIAGLIAIAFNLI